MPAAPALLPLPEEDDITPPSGHGGRQERGGMERNEVGPYPVAGRKKKRRNTWFRRQRPIRVSP